MRAHRVPIAIAACLAFVVSLPAAAVVRAAEPTFGDARLTGSFDKDVVATQQITLDTRPDRIEVLATIADSPGPLVDEVRAPTETGSQTLSYTIVPDVGTFLPNTPISVRWRITTDGVSVIGPESRIVLDDERFDWQNVSGDVVRVHWYEGDRAFGERALRIGEQAVKDASELLGVHEEQPVDFFIYADQDAFYKALGPGTRENVGGQADAEIRTLFAHIPPSSIDDPWVENVVPHELVHLVFDSAVKNPYHFPPRWLNEGLAVYLSVGYDAEDRSTVEGAARDGTLVPLSGLTGEFPTSADGFSQAYAESVSAIDFLVRTHSRDALVKLIRSYADGRTDDEAFEAAIDMDTEAFDQAWLADLKAVAPTKYGPKPAPPGPVPAAWGGSLTPDQGEPVAPAPFTVTSRTVLLAALLVVILLGSALLMVRRGGGRGPRPRSMAPGP
jgi:Peptidase MA superfamily